MRRIVLLFVISVISAGNLCSKEFRIFFIKKEFDLGTRSNGLFRDYYTNIGTQNGVTKGTHLDVYRKVQVIDSQHGGAPVEVRIYVGQLKAIFVNSNITIARASSLADEESNPVLDYQSFLVGDLVEIGKPKSKQTARMFDIDEAKKSAESFIGYLIQPFINSKEGLILDLYKL
ncbi:MAG: hypothetical protein JXA66_06240 [Oligoflexia bacterium]|nr:hypothetical protein [Oligoflexia bacterium]